MTVDVDFFSSESFPAILTPKQCGSDAVAWAKQNQVYICELLNEHGAYSLEVLKQMVAKDQSSLRQQHPRVNGQSTQKPPLTVDRCWFNHGTFFNIHSLEPEVEEFFLSNFGQEGLPYNAYYEAGSDVEPEVIETVRGLYEKYPLSFL